MENVENGPNFHFFTAVNHTISLQYLLQNSHLLSCTTSSLPKSLIKSAGDDRTHCDRHPADLHGAEARSAFL
jgi:hypothetical protein